ncbi:MAG: hypothetical protein MUC62_00770 [Candidatus Thermoplasmatota archaeon]|nr:hypothetical protein [Candidatus Thermoplasmatota archaeon]
MPDDFKGSIMNLDLSGKLLFWAFGFLLPVLFLSLTIPLIFLTDLWPIMLIPDLLSLFVSIYLSGNFLRGYSISFKKDGLEYKKGWSNRSIPFSSIRCVYRVTAKGKDTVMMVFTERTGPIVVNRSFHVEQEFLKQDRASIFRRLSAAGKNRFRVENDASLAHIKAERSSLGHSSV